MQFVGSRRANFTDRRRVPRAFLPPACSDLPFFARVSVPLESRISGRLTLYPAVCPPAALSTRWSSPSCCPLTRPAWFLPGLEGVQSGGVRPRPTEAATWAWGPRPQALHSRSRATRVSWRVSEHPVKGRSPGTAQEPWVLLPPLSGGRWLSPVCLPADWLMSRRPRSRHLRLPRCVATHVSAQVPLFFELSFWFSRPAASVSPLDQRSPVTEPTGQERRSNVASRRGFCRLPSWPASARREPSPSACSGRHGQPGTRRFQGSSPRSLESACRLPRTRGPFEIFLFFFFLLVCCSPRTGPPSSAAAVSDPQLTAAGVTAVCQGAWGSPQGCGFSRPSVGPETRGPRGFRAAGLGGGRGAAPR